MPSFFDDAPTDVLDLIYGYEAQLRVWDNAVGTLTIALECAMYDPIMEEGTLEEVNENLRRLRDLTEEPLSIGWDMEAKWDLAWRAQEIEHTVFDDWMKNILTLMRIENPPDLFAVKMYDRVNQIGYMTALENEGVDMAFSCVFDDDAANEICAQWPWIASSLYFIEVMEALRDIVKRDHERMKSVI